MPRGVGSTDNVPDPLLAPDLKGVLADEFSGLPVGDAVAALGRFRRGGFFMNGMGADPELVAGALMDMPAPVAALDGLLVEGSGLSNESVPGP
mmetsp:Transcript_40404/g.89748  ORF Transcript_40404/g.89748 Transcript_40404/m.89748 type:complete len:93 (-) Transcript_40404:707-985(-)